jgi:hypothetical protein
VKGVVGSFILCGEERAPSLEYHCKYLMIQALAMATELLSF